MRRRDYPAAFDFDIYGEEWMDEIPLGLLLEDELADEDDEDDLYPDLYDQMSYVMDHDGDR